MLTRHCGFMSLAGGLGMALTVPTKNAWRLYRHCVPEPAEQSWIWVTSLLTPVLILEETEVLKSTTLRGEGAAVTDQFPIASPGLTTSSWRFVSRPATHLTLNKLFQRQGQLKYPVCNLGLSLVLSSMGQQAHAHTWSQ